VDRRGRTSRPRSRQEARARARRQLGQKREGPPTWSSAAGRGLFGAAIFLLLLIALFGRPVGPSVLLAALMLLIYIPLGHYIDRFFYARRQAAKRRERERDAGRG
jgi:drug/metabolite transporter (DMT)-like permease